MIKYYCDRCGAEIENKSKCTENVMVQFDGGTDRTVFRGTLVGRLYCEKCKMELAEWINVKLSAEDGNAVR